MNTRRRSPLEEKLSWLLTTMDAWLFTTVKYLSGFAKGPFPAGLRGIGAGGQEEKKKISTRIAKGLPARKNAQRPPAAARGLTAQRGRLRHSSQRRAELRSPALSSRASRGGRAWNGLCSSNRSCGSKPSGQIPPQAPPVQSSGSKGDASLEKQGEGRGNPSLWGLSTGVWGKGRSRLERMRREGRCCPFKRRWRGRDLFSFPGRRAEPRLGAQGGEVRSWAWEGGARSGTPPSRPPCGLPVCLPRSVTEPGSKSTVRLGGAAETSCGAGCPGQGRGDRTGLAGE